MAHIHHGILCMWGLSLFPSFLFFFFFFLFFFFFFFFKDCGSVTQAGLSWHDHGTKHATPTGFPTYKTQQRSAYVTGLFHGAGASLDILKGDAGLAHGDVVKHTCYQVVYRDRC